MQGELRNSGIDVVGSVPWGTHFCQFYQTKQDLIEILVPYFKAGLENNELCMWITSEPLTVLEAQEAMREAIKDFDEYLCQGQIEVIPYNEWYLLGGKFNEDRVLAAWVNKLEEALARGYSGLRLTGNTFWPERNHWHAFTEYETKVNDVIGKYNMLALCTYSLDKCDGAAVIDVVKNHQFALVKQKGNWDIIESAIYKQTQQALLESKEDLNRAQAVAHTGSWRLDVRHNQLLWSDETHRIFGIPKGMPMTYETFLASVHPEDREYVDQEWTAALRGEPYDIEHRIIVGDEVKWVREKAELEFDSRGLLKGGFGTVQDMTEHKKLDQLKDDFIGLVSHELRSPMTVITGAINTALTEAERLSPEETRQLLKDASLESELLSHLLGNLLELSRVQASRLVLHAEAIDIKRVIQDAVERIKRQSSTHQFVVKLPRKLPLVYADPLRLERILYNLLENAVKYSPQGGKIQVSAKPEGEYLVIGVSDQGVGISPADQDKLFAPFQRLEEFRPEAARGVGLGLLVCRRLVEAHGGRIWVESKPGYGSTFFFTLPLSQKNPQATMS
jgi:signal transduction histidine kinase